MADYQKLPDKEGNRPGLPPTNTVSFKQCEDQESPRCEAEESPRCNCKIVTGFLVLAALVGGIVYIGVFDAQAAKDAWHDFLAWCKSMGWKSGVVVAIVTWLCTSVGLPASAFFVGSSTVFANLYGPNYGALFAILTCGSGFWAGCVTAFVLARSCLKPMVEKKLQEFEVMRAVNMIIAEDGWRFAFLMRLSPFMPVEVFNFACAMTTLSYRDNALACFGSLPVASFEMWMWAQAAAAAMKHHSDDESKDSNSHQALIMIAINVPIIVLVVLVVRHANKKYHEKVDQTAAPVTGKEELKNRRTVMSHYRKASTMSVASKALGTSQATELVVKKTRNSLERLTTVIR
uniref:VTT domain-containing protein n=1 Tax=Alexandrium catenella TaxID=2925 RepID=A0A7S1RHK7_ALECA